MGMILYVLGTILNIKIRTTFPKKIVHGLNLAQYKNVKRINKFIK